MTVKSQGEVQAAIAAAQGGVAASGDTANDVMAACAPVAAMYDSVEAIPLPVIIALALQLIPIIFGEGGFTIEKLQAVLQIILSIFTV